LTREARLRRYVKTTRITDESLRVWKDDNISLWCLACEYNAQLGIAMYDKMFDIVWMYEFTVGDVNG